MKILQIINPKISSCVNKSIRRTSQYTRSVILGVSLTTATETMHPSTESVSKDIVSILSKQKNSPIEDVVQNFKGNLIWNLAKEAVSKEINTGNFNKSLTDNKKILMKELHINKKQYSDYESAIKKIGASDYYIADDYGCNSHFEEEIRPPTYEYKECRFLNKIYDNLKRETYDMGRFVIDSPNKNEEKLMKKFGVDYSKSSIKPEKMAIGTIIHLAELEKGYQEYIKKVDSLMPNLKDKKIKESVNRAQRILNDEETASFAILALETSNFRFPFIKNDLSLSFDNHISKSELDDIRLYASTIKLSKIDYLSAMWDSLPIIPDGKKSDKACANILRILQGNRE